MAARLAFLVLNLVCGLPAFAALGAPTASILKDRDQLHGSLTTQSMQAYDVHEIKAGSGAVVREYAYRSGGIFAVTWSGPRSPDLQILLGNQFQVYLDAARIHRGNHHLLSLDRPDLVLKVVRLQRSAFGLAYLPQLMPGGMSRDEIK